MKNPRPPFFDRLKNGLEEAILHAQGKLELKETLCVVPNLPAPPHYEPKDIVKVRERLGLSQNALANVLHISIKTVQGWEQGRRTPSGVAARFLQMLEEPQTFQALFVGDSPEGKRRRTGKRQAAG